MDEQRIRMLVAGAFGGEPLFETTEQLVERVVEELIEWRSGCEGGLGILTTTPRKTLVAYGAEHRELRKELELVNDLTEEIGVLLIKLRTKVRLLTDS
jgi:hypothetical protein